MSLVRILSIWVLSTILMLRLLRRQVPTGLHQESRRLGLRLRQPPLRSTARPKAQELDQYSSPSTPLISSHASFTL